LHDSILMDQINENENHLIILYEHHHKFTIQWLSYIENTYDTQMIVLTNAMQTYD
jgi:hypothetical protein